MNMKYWNNDIVTSYEIQHFFRWVKQYATISVLTQWVWMTFSEKIKIWSKQLNKLVKRNCLLNFDVLVMVSMNNNVMNQLKSWPVN